MARRIKNRELDSRTARLKLKPRRSPYRAKIGPKHYLAYRRLTRDRDGTVKLQVYTGKASNPYETSEDLGVLEDYNDANGDTILTFHQAVGLARKHMHDAVTKKAAPFDVAAAVRLYLKDIEAEGRDPSALIDIRRKLEKFVLQSSLESQPLETLTTEQLTDWCAALVIARPQARTGAGKPQNYRRAPDTEDAQTRA